MVTFPEFLKVQIEGKNKRYSSYCGITKKDFPKWPGWDILKDMENPEGENETLEVLVRNFYYVEYLESKFK